MRGVIGIAISIGMGVAGVNVLEGISHGRRGGGAVDGHDPLDGLAGVVPGRGGAHGGRREYPGVGGDGEEAGAVPGAIRFFLALLGIDLAFRARAASIGGGEATGNGHHKGMDVPGRRE